MISTAKANSPNSTRPIRSMSVASPSRARSPPLCRIPLSTSAVVRITVPSTAARAAPTTAASGRCPKMGSTRNSSALSTPSSMITNRNRITMAPA